MRTASIGGIAILLLGFALAAGCGRTDGTATDAGPAGHDHGGEADTAAVAAEVEMCGEHAVPEAECGICDPDAVAGLAPGEGLKVRLPAGDSAALVGVRTAAAVTGPALAGVECLAEVVFNQNRLARVTVPVGGIVKSVEVDLGARVGAGQTVARVWSAAIADAVARAVLSHQTLARELRLRAEGITPAKDLEEAEAAHRAACQQARTLGFSDREIESLSHGGEEPIYLEVRAPFAGEIVERAAVQGALVEPGTALFSIADRSVVWALLSLPETALPQVRVGQEVRLVVDALPAREFAGRLTWVSAQVDERTRMAQARAEVPDPEGRLRSGMFARARVLTPRGGEALFVPDAAVQRVNGTALVFVRLADDLYEARAVQLGDRVADRWEVVAGLDPGEPVAVAHSFALKSQLLLSRLGAGCADD